MLLIVALIAALVLLALKLALKERMWSMHKLGIVFASTAVAAGLLVGTFSPKEVTRETVDTYALNSISGNQKVFLITDRQKELPMVNFNYDLLESNGNSKNLGVLFSSARMFEDEEESPTVTVKRVVTNLPFLFPWDMTPTYEYEFHVPRGSSLTNI